jgi:ubiquinone/menaquinone biosynthesis C-methylase UbiE
MMRTLRRVGDLGINGIAAKWYDQNTREHRLDEMARYAEEVDAHIENDALVLEVAPGPGYLAIELARLGDYEITGVDISEDFVEIARKNAAEVGVTVTFEQGNAADLPFGDEQFDFIVCTAAFKNFNRPRESLEEMYRVLKPGGTALIMDMNRNITDQDIRTEIRRMGVTGVEEIFMKFMFKYFLRRGAYTKTEFDSLATSSDFEEWVIQLNGISLQTYFHK